MIGRLLAIVTIWGLTGSSLTATSIRGSISVEMTSTSPVSESSGGYGSRRYKFLEKIDYSNLEGFVVSVQGPNYEPAPGQEVPIAVVAQEGGAFIPSVLPVVVGTRIQWPNRDEIYHNVFSISESRPFDLGYYKNDEEAKSVPFNKVGRVDVFCSIHSQMSCVVLVLPNPWFAVSDSKGRFEIENAPPGNYQLKAWHERLPAKLIEIKVPDAGSVDVEIVMDLAEIPKF